MIKFLLTLIFLFTILTSHAQWVQTSGPEEVLTMCLVKYDSVIYCGTVQGIYYSLNEGNTWLHYPFFQKDFIYSIYAMNDTILVLYERDFSIYTTTSFDKGNNWTTPVALNITNVTRIQYHVYKHNIVIESTYGGTFITYDYGVSWSVLIPPQGIFNHVRFNGNYILYLLDDSTSTPVYSFITNGDSINFLRVDSLNTIQNKFIVDSIIFGERMNSPGHYDLFKSDDLGQTWDTIGIPNITTPFDIGVYDSIFYYQGDSTIGYQLTYDYGLTWTYVPLSKPPLFTQYSDLVKLNNNDLLLSTSNVNLSYYISNTDSIFELHTGIKGSNANGIISDDSKIYCKTTEALYRSDDFGNSWIKTNPSYNAYMPQLVFGDTLFYTQGPLYKSFDGGATWSQIYLPRSVGWMARKGNRIFASGGVTYYSDDFGSSWDSLIPLPQSPCGSFVTGGSLCVLGNYLFMVDFFYGAVFRLDQNYTQWTYCFCVPPTSSFSLTFIQTINNSLLISNNEAIYYSNDSGNTWLSSACNGIPIDRNGNKIIPASIVGKGTDWIAACGSAGVMYSYNNGDDWYPFEPAGTPFLPTQLTIANNQLFAGSYGQGVWTTSTILDTKNINSRNNSFDLYPNPASDKIYLHANSQTDFDISIFNSIGQLILKEKISPDQQLDIKKLPSGIYFGKALLKNEEYSVFKFVVNRN